jgi:hypothetical protein
MTVVNAFNWQEYTDQEHAKNGDPFASIRRNAVISANVTDGMNRVRDKKPTHGTILGITTKRISLKAPDMMPMKGGARFNAGRKLPKIDERRALTLLNEGLTKKEIAKRFDVPYKSMLTFFKKLGAQDSRGPYDWSGKYKKESI